MNGHTFLYRHIGPRTSDIKSMLSALNVSSLDELTQKCTPLNIQNKDDLNLPKGLTEIEFLKKAKIVASKNKLNVSLIGQGYYNSHLPSVIQRCIFENPGWYTAYTPYQAEISQGRMEALINFQTLIQDLTALDMANASLLDEATAAAEAMTMAFRAQRQFLRKHKGTQKIVVDKDIFPQTLEVINTRAKPLNIEVVCKNLLNTNPADEEAFAYVASYPSASGEINNYKDFTEQAHSDGALVIAISDLLSLCTLTPPGEWGADIVVGSSQRFGVPMGFGGPHAGFMATRSTFKRNLPGRIIGISKDAHGNAALRLSLQTREQHLRREKATSNICTSQVLLAVLASMYAVYHGPNGLKRIANDIFQRTAQLKSVLTQCGFNVINTNFFDTLTIKASAKEIEDIKMRSLEKNINLNFNYSGQIRLSMDETTNDDHFETLLEIFNLKNNDVKINNSVNEEIAFSRTSSFLNHSIFNSHHSETQMMRYIYSLEKKDISLTQSMIPLGSCTMKLNSATEMQPVTWPEFAHLHPFVPNDQALGYAELIKELESWLCEITGYSAISFQPNAGSQGEYAGLLVIQKYHASNNEAHRDICLIPTSAHGTNPASAALAGLKVVPISCDDQGNINIEDLKEKAQLHKDNLSSLMITYPSTHGVFETEISEICNIVHEFGGQVYLDGANLNALMGVAKPGEFGSDVSHLNLHKTFAIPHGGGGPGVGPIGVKDHLKEFLPGHAYFDPYKNSINAVSAAPQGSASILPISWAFCLMLGGEGLKKSSQVAILNANYIAKKLEPHFDILYKGIDNFVAHECIIDVRPFKTSAQVTVDDIAKRLMDYGFHAPTMSWPVAGTLMIEPTESESTEELDKFCEALLQIKTEIKNIESGKMSSEDNVLKNAPHTAEHLLSENWSHPYSREQAAYPLTWVKANKYWPPVGRVDNVFGDKNLFCSCDGWGQINKES